MLQYFFILLLSHSPSLFLSALWWLHCGFHSSAQRKLQSWAYIRHLPGSISIFFYYPIVWVQIKFNLIFFVITSGLGFPENLPIAICIKLWQLLASPKGTIILLQFSCIWNMISHSTDIGNSLLDIFCQIPLKATPHQVAYYAEKSLYALIVSVPVSGFCSSEICFL